MELPRPEVTVVDPRRPAALVPVEEPSPPRLGRRGAALLAVAGVVGAAALVAADLARDRREAVEQRRLDGVVELELAEPRSPWASSHDPRTGTGTVDAAVRLRNLGPRDVRVVAAELGGLRGLDGLGLEARDGDGVLRLQRTVRCPADGSPPPPQEQPGQLRLRVETPAGPRDAVLEGTGLPLGSFDDSVQRACLHPPLGESVRLGSTVVRAERTEVVLRVEAVNEGRTPVRLLSLVPARGLVVQSVSGDAAALPLLLPVQTGRAPAVRTLEVRLAVVCGALIGADLLRPFEELSAIVEDAERSQMTSVGTLSRDPGLELRQLAGRTCFSG